MQAATRMASGRVAVAGLRLVLRTGPAAGRAGAERALRAVAAVVAAAACGRGRDLRGARLRAGPAVRDALGARRLGRGGGHASRSRRARTRPAPRWPSRWRRCCFATRARPGWAGAMAALAAFWRPDVGAVAALAAAATLLLVRREEAREAVVEGGGAGNGHVALPAGRRSSERPRGAATGGAAGAVRARRGEARARAGAERVRRGVGEGAGGRGEAPAARARWGRGRFVGREDRGVGGAAGAGGDLPARGHGRRARALCAVSRRRRTCGRVGRAGRAGHARRGVVAAAVPGRFPRRRREGLPGVARAVRRAGRARARGGAVPAHRGARDPRPRGGDLLRVAGGSRARAGAAGDRGGGRGVRAAEARRRRVPRRCCCSSGPPTVPSALLRPPDLAPYKGVRVPPDEARGAAADGRRGAAPRPARGADLRRAAALGPRHLQQPADPLPHGPPERPAPRRPVAGQTGGAGADHRRARARAAEGDRALDGAGVREARAQPARPAERLARARRVPRQRVRASKRRFGDYEVLRPARRRRAPSPCRRAP